MKIAVGADHAGYIRNERPLGKLRAGSRERADFGTYSTAFTARAWRNSFLNTQLEDGRRARRIDTNNQLERQEQQ